MAKTMSNAKYQRMIKEGQQRRSYIAGCTQAKPNPLAVNNNRLVQIGTHRLGRPISARELDIMRHIRQMAD